MKAALCALERFFVGMCLNMFFVTLDVVKFGGALEALILFASLASSMGQIDVLL